MHTKTNLKTSLVMVVLLVVLGGAAWAEVVVDDFDSYGNTTELRAVWNDYWVNGTSAEVFVETDANFTEDGNSMRYEYNNDISPYYSEAYADIADLGIDSNWASNGIEALTLSFMGKIGNALDYMYVALRDGSNVTAKVMHPDVNELAQEWKGFQQWNIELWDFVDDNSVDLTDIQRITIGFGDKTAGGSGTVYFDNIILRILLIYVDANATGANNGSSWGDAYNYLQDALDDPCLSLGYDIWVAQGTYKPDANTANGGGSGNREATFQLINGVAIYGGLAGDEDPCTFELADRDLVANETILSGDIGVADVNTDNSYHVVTGSGTEPSAVLDGFTITAGNANGSYPHDCGGGMYNNSGRPTITCCTFIEDCACNYGGGMYNDGSSPRVTNCTFTSNSASGGGGMFNNNSSDPNITNCTFSGNPVNSGGGMHNYVSSNPTVTNCILWGNTAPSGAEIYNDGTSLAAVNYSCVQDEDPEDANIYPGTGNIDDDPLFVDPNGPDTTPGTEDDNLRLSYGSPCIDAGDNSAVPAGVTRDIEGELRFVGIVDMGAYEYSCGGPERPYPVGDLNRDCHVDFFDIAIVAAHWLECTAIECD